jgi:hypothetical protein
MPPTNTLESTVSVPIQSQYIHSHYCATPYSFVPTDQFPPDDTKIVTHIQNSLANVHFAFIGADLTGLPAAAYRVELKLYRLEQHCPLPFMFYGPSFTIRYMTAPWDWGALRPACEYELPPVDFLTEVLLPPPPPDGWFSFDITNLYNAWQSGSCPNHGLRLEHLSVYDNTWTIFASERYPDVAKQPKLVVTTRPVLTLKLPLPGGRGWLLTTQAGGSVDCASSWVDAGHQGRHHYALDIAPVSYNGEVVTTEAEVPVYAAADGTIAEVDDPNHADNGHYVLINHSVPVSTARDAGLCSLYLHLAQASPWQVGQRVRCGEQIGVMGDTGPYSRGRHLHFELQCNGQGEAEAAILNRVVLENRLITDYRIECEEGQRVTYYWSSNRP